MVEYGERYDYLEQADVIISATESPRYTLTAGEAAGYLADCRERLFIDIAVPADMDKDIGTLPGCRLISIDDFERLARRNNTVSYTHLDVYKRQEGIGHYVVLRESGCPGKAGRVRYDPDTWRSYVRQFFLRYL